MPRPERRPPSASLTRPLVLLALLSLAIPSWAAPTVTGGASSSMAVQTQVIKLNPGLSASLLAARPNTDLVELANGRRVSLGDIRRLRGVAQKLRSPAAAMPVPAPFRMQPAATGKRLETASDLALALKRPDSETVELPSGRRVTVGQIHFVQPEVEKALGRPLSSLPQRPDLSGPAVKIASVTNWKEFLQKSDNTILEAPDGTRITLGELKTSFAASKGKIRALPTSKATQRRGQ